LDADIITADRGLRGVEAMESVLVETGDFARASDDLRFEAARLDGL
jgi:hypothetical protein